MNSESYTKLYKEGQKDLKTSFFSFKFKPDYLSAVGNFTDAAKGFRSAKKFKEALESFEQAIFCNRKLHESWAEGQNLLAMAEICFYDLKDFNTGINHLCNAVYAIKLAGKVNSAIRIYLDQAQKMLENENYKNSVSVLEKAYEDCLNGLEDELVRITLEETVNKLLNAYCLIENYQSAIEMLEKYIKILINYKETKSTISKYYLKLAMLRIITEEIYMAERIEDDMMCSYDRSCGDDIEDLKGLVKSFKDGNKQKFGYLVTYAFSLFENNLLKALRKSFEKVEREQIVENNNNNNNRNNRNININNNVDESGNLDETNDKSEVSENVGNVEEENQRNNTNNTNVNIDEFL
jgi:tetratricopeptide (TPR) repeat protein